MSVPAKFCFDVCHGVYKEIMERAGSIALMDPTKVPSDHLWRSHKAPTGEEYAADFSIACKRALEGPHHSPRLILCKLYYLQLVEYDVARRHMGIREDVFVHWMDEVRHRVGQQLLEKRMFPPRKYFGERTRARKGLHTKLTVIGRAVNF